MKTTRIAVGVAVLGLVAYEVYAAITGGVTISDWFWSDITDKQVVGAPIVAIIGFLGGHLLWPSDKKSKYPTATLIGILAWMAYEVVCWLVLPDWKWCTSRLVYSWFTWMGIPMVDVFLIHLVAGHFIWTRDIGKRR
jgi:hypothetical protein